jgi:Rrf2 family protein
VQVTLSNKGNYGVRAILDLAHAYGGPRRKAREIAQMMRVPQNFLAIILAELVRAGLLNATAGKEGGYTLARPPRGISLLEVVEAVEGPIVLTECLLRGISCGQDGYCAAHEAWSSAQSALMARLARVSFADLARADSALRGTGAEAGTPAAPGRRSGKPS